MAGALPAFFALSVPRLNLRRLADDRYPLSRWTARLGKCKPQNRRDAAMITQLGSNALLAAAILIAATSSSLPATASEGLTSAPTVAKRMYVAPAPALRFARPWGRYKQPARIVWIWGHNPVML